MAKQPTPISIIRPVVAAWKKAGRPNNPNDAWFKGEYDGTVGGKPAKITNPTYQTVLKWEKRLSMGGESGSSVGSGRKPKRRNEGSGSAVGHGRGNGMELTTNVPAVSGSLEAVRGHLAGFVKQLGGKVTWGN